MNSDVFLPPAKYLAELFGVSVRTARRWRQRSKCPPAVTMILSQDLGVFDPKWAGWRVHDGELISPENWRVGVSEVRTVPIMHQQIAVYRAENHKLRRELTQSINEQPLPSEWQLDTCLWRVKEI